MRLSEFRRLVPGSHSIGLTQIGAEMLLADIDAEIAKARLGSSEKHIDWRVENCEKHIAALESSEVELREHCQGNVPMSVFKALATRVEALEAAPHVAAKPLGEKPTGEKSREPIDEDDAYKAWRSEPWPDPHVGDGMKFEQAFRAGFRAGRK